jgi:hypothetical protein
VFPHPLPRPAFWTGALNTNWAAARNWSNNIAPKAGDTLLFPQGTGKLVTWNQPATAFDTIWFEDAFTVGGSPLKPRSLFANPGAGFFSLQAGIQFQAGGSVGGVRGMNLLGAVNLAGDTAVAGFESAIFSGPVSGPGRLECLSWATLRQTNSHTGGIIIRSNAVVTLEAAGTLGADTAPVEVSPGGQLTIRNVRSIPQPLLIGGFGRRNAGWSVMAEAPVKLFAPLTLSSTTQIGTAPSSTASLTIAGADAAPGTADPLLIKSGVGPMSLVSPTNQFFVPLQIAQGDFELIRASPSPRHSLFGGPVFHRSLTVGPFTNRQPVCCDVVLPRSLGTGPLLPNFVFGPESVVTVLSNATLIVGPRQQGLGNPLIPDDGTALLIDYLFSPRPARRAHRANPRDRQVGVGLRRLAQRDQRRGCPLHQQRPHPLRRQPLACSHGG